MPEMSTPLKALIQERLRAKIVRRTDEDYDYEGDVYPPSSGRSQPPPPSAMHGSYSLNEAKDRSLSKPPASSSVSSTAGFPPRLHTEIDPAAYIPHGQPMSARGYSHHLDDLSPSPTFSRLDHHHHHGSYYSRHDDVAMYHDGRHAYSSRSRHEIPSGLEMLASPRWDEPPRDLLRMNNPSPSPSAREHFHRQPSSETHGRRWQDKSSTAVHHRSDRRRYEDDRDSDNNSHEGLSPMREFRHERKRERSQEIDLDHRPRDTGSNQLWHDVPMSKFSSKRDMDDRDGLGYSVRPAERASSFASSLVPSEHYMAAKHSSSHHLHRLHHHHHSHQQDEDASEESMTSRVFLLSPDSRSRPVESQQSPQLTRDARAAPTPLDLSAITSSQRSTRSFDQILSPDSRLAANAFVEKRQRRSGKSTPRTMATQSWLRSLDLHERPLP